MGKQKPVIAICYDFDGTLSPGNMQEYGFFSALGQKGAREFWANSTELARSNHADPILAYMKLMIEEAKSGKIPTTKQAFKDYGRDARFFPGVADWFDRINAYGKKQGMKIEHYIVSSGLKEIIEGTSISKKFLKIYACSFIYDNNDVAIWPAVAVNYTTKTQFLFRINKGIEDDNDNETINTYIPEADRSVPFAQMIYIGDGATDIPCMKLVKEKGGHSIAVYAPGRGKGSKKSQASKLFGDGRINFLAEADYTPNSTLSRLIEAVIRKISAEITLESLGKETARTSSRPCHRKDDQEEQIES